MLHVLFCTPSRYTLWCQLEDMFQLIGTSQGIERVLFQIIVTPEYFEKYRVKYKVSCPTNAEYVFDFLQPNGYIN